jgi:hypothetical protein
LAWLAWGIGAISVGGFVLAGVLARDAEPAQQVLAMGWSRAVGLVIVLAVVFRARRYVAVRPVQVLTALAPGASLACLGLVLAWCLQWILSGVGVEPMLIALTAPSVALLVSWGTVPVVDRQIRWRLRRMVRERLLGRNEAVAPTEPVPPVGRLGP